MLPRPPFQLTTWGLREGKGPAQGHRASGGGPSAAPACWKHSQHGPDPARGQGLGRQVLGGGPSQRLVLAEGRACRAWASGLAAEEPDSCSGYFDNNTLNTWCVFGLKQAGPAPCNVSPTAKSPKKSTYAPPRATGRALTVASPQKCHRTLVSRLNHRGLERPQLALGWHSQALRSQEQAQERGGEGAGVPLLWGQRG